MNDYNDPNFLLADSDPIKKKAEIERAKNNVKDMLWIGFVFLIIWGAATIYAISKLSG